jgi:cytochrome c553
MNFRIDVIAAGAAGLLCAAAHGRAGSSGAQAPDRANTPVISLAATCAGCHGTDGLGTPNAAIPPIAGLPPERFVAQMRAFRDGDGNPTIMRQIAAGYSEEQTQALAAYFAGVAQR